MVVPYATSRSPTEFLTLMAREGVTVLNQTPSAFYQLMQADLERPQLGRSLALRHVIFGGEALDPRRLDGWYERHADGAPALINMYGITETTVHVSHIRSTASLPLAGAGSPHRPRRFRTLRSMYWTGVWSLFLPGLLGSFTLRVRGWRVAIWGERG